MNSTRGLISILTYIYMLTRLHSPLFVFNRNVIISSIIMRVKRRLIFDYYLNRHSYQHEIHIAYQLKVFFSFHVRLFFSSSVSYTS